MRRSINFTCSMMMVLVASLMASIWTKIDVERCRTLTEAETTGYAGNGTGTCLANK